MTKKPKMCGQWPRCGCEVQGEKHPGAPFRCSNFARPAPPDDPDRVGTFFEWEEHVFRTAHHFSVVLIEKNMSTVCSTFPEALLYSKLEARSLVYAVTERGRSICLERKDWGKWLKIWTADMIEETVTLIGSKMGDTPAEDIGEPYKIALQLMLDRGFRPAVADVVANGAALVYVTQQEQTNG